jgi:hypothetical protein
LSASKSATIPELALHKAIVSLGRVATSSDCASSLRQGAQYPLVGKNPNNKSSAMQHYADPQVVPMPGGLAANRR